ncbi:MAG: hypothetical protein AAGB46_09565 [Verrucomicrobiota bacterium]
MSTDLEERILEVTWKRATRVWWSYLWRNLVAVIVGFAASFIVSFVVGAILGMIGVDLQIIRIIGGAIGFVIGFGVSIVPVKMILGKSFGSYRLVLLKNIDNLSIANESVDTTERSAPH